MRIDKILVANRGEIAVRVLRACREMGIRSVAVYSEADRDALHVRRADEAYPLGPAPSRDSYLRGDKLLEIARRASVDAIHPGYGFLSESAAFARACEDAGVVFIGPRSETIALMGEKTSARRVAAAAGVPVVPGTLERLADGALLAEAEKLGFPVMLKAAAGGGGKGLRLVNGAAELPAALQRARSEAGNAFGDDSVYLEKALLRPRHVEIQVLADHHGNAVHLFERECSLQRRHQKLLEESPSPLLTPELRERMGELALQLVRQAGYRNAGTLEFLVDAEKKPYFLEMNTRLQVEHPVTEAVTDIDLVNEQIRVAAGFGLSFTQEDVHFEGHAIECRVNAEDPRTFAASPGKITNFHPPGGLGVRVDSALYAGYRVPSHYDSLIAKLVVHGKTRNECLMRLRRALEEIFVGGIKSNIALHRRIIAAPDFINGDYDIRWLERFVAG